MRRCTYSTYFERGTVGGALHGKALRLPTGLPGAALLRCFYRVCRLALNRTIERRSPKQGLSKGPTYAYAPPMWTYRPRYFTPGEINLCQRVGASQISRLG
jgi:hypothetical protein